MLAAIQGVNAAFELIGAGNLILTKLYELQQQRAADGKTLTQADLASLMNQGDVKAAIERAQLLAAKAAQDAS